MNIIYVSAARQQHVKRYLAQKLLTRAYTRTNCLAIPNLLLFAVVNISIFSICAKCNRDSQT